VPNQTTLIRTDGPLSPNANWTFYNPNVGGPNPDYSALGPPVDYYRTFVDVAGSFRASFNMIFTGSFAAGDVLADFLAGNLEIYIYRVSGLGNVGPPPGNTTPLRIHLPLILQFMMMELQYPDQVLEKDRQ
ncbi:MAG: hypothetical protein HC877_23435, partial [Thioploca sp.]|nr:hypothetical protein [Thioploca sp.]